MLSDEENVDVMLSNLDLNNLERETESSIHGSIVANKRSIKEYIDFLSE